MPDKNRSAPGIGNRGTTPDTSTTTSQKEADATRVNDLAGVASRQVSWWSVHEYVAPQLAAVASWPMVGTPAWCALDDDDPAKLAALLDAAQHHALRVEIAQEARCEASQAISATADWPAIAQELRSIDEFYAAHPWAKRVTA